MANADAVGIAMLQAGFPPNRDVIATGMAIVECESGFSANAKNPSSGAAGWWQFLNHPECSKPSCYANLGNATKFAKKLYDGRGGGWGDWVSSQGCWSKKKAGYLKTADKVIIGKGDPSGSGPAIDVGAVGDIASSLPDPMAGIQSVAAAIGDIAKFIARLFEPTFWLRVGKAIFGMILLAYGLSVLSKSILGVDIAGPAKQIAAARA